MTYIKNVMSGVDLSHEHLCFSSRNKMIFIQSIKKYNINFQQKNMMFCILLFLSDRCLMDNYSTSHYYLFRESSCPQVLTKDTTDDWGITCGKRSKIVHGCYFDRTRKLLFKLLDKKRSIISVASIIYISR
jgi:hypothetical protein